MGLKPYALSHHYNYTDSCLGERYLVTKTNNVDKVVQNVGLLLETQSKQ